MALWDRVAAKTVPRVPPGATPGRYMADGAGGVAFGGTPAAPGDRLVAGSDGSWSAAPADGDTSAGRFAPETVIEPAEQSALDGLAHELGAAAGELEWERLRAALPFRRPTPDLLEPGRVERAIEAHGPHLLEVARVPHRHLDAIVESVPAALARRIPPRAIEHLAEHSEDWQRRTVSSVIPRRVLSQHADEQLDVYENRLVARTIDRLLDHLGRRNRALKAYKEQFDAAEETKLDGQHWSARRLATLWGTSVDTERQRTLLYARQAQVEGRLRRIGALKDSELYRAIPRLATIGGRLRVTNVLANHQHYRRVVALWRELELAPARSPTEVYPTAQLALRAFDAFALALLARALHGLGYAPAAGVGTLELTAAGDLALEGPRGALTLAWDPLHGATLHRGAEPLMRLVPLATRLAGTGGGASRRQLASMRARAEELLEAAASSDARQTVVLYPGRRSEREELPEDLAELLNPPTAGLAQAAPSALLPASPLDLYSVERVERAVRRVVLVDLFERFPPRVPCPRAARETAATLVPWLAVDPAGEGLLLLSDPGAAEYARLRAAVHERTRKLHAHREEPLRRALSALPDAVELAAREYARLRACPVCGQDGAIDPSWTGEHFRLTCGACHASWGMRPCASCQQRVPFLALGGEQGAEDRQVARSSRRDKVARSERLDRAYGRDLLAVPHPDVEGAFRCPACGG